MKDMRKRDSSQGNTFLDQDNSRETRIKVPEVDRRDTTFKVEFSVGIERLIGCELKLAKLDGRIGRLSERWREFVGPWRPIHTYRFSLQKRVNGCSSIDNA